jgi:hypothetical protein
VFTGAFFAPQKKSTALRLVSHPNVIRTEAEESAVRMQTDQSGISWHLANLCTGAQ